MKRFLLAVLSVLSFGCLEAKDAPALLAVYPDYPAAIERDATYEVSVSQAGVARSLVVYNHCEKSPLSTRTRGGDVNRRFCEFAFSGAPVRVDIRVKEDVKSYAVFPSRLQLPHAFSNGVLSVWLKEPAFFGVRLNDCDKSILSVFADAPECPARIPQKGAPGVLYVDGWVDATREDGILETKDDIREIYLAPGSVLNARLVVSGKGTRVHGRGMMLDPFSDIFRFDQTKNTRRGFFIVNAPDVTVEDIKLIDARTFNFCSFQPNVTFRRVRALSTMMCSDGITCGWGNFRVEGAWLYVGDNGLVISGIEGAFFRDIVIGTSCNAIFPQGTNLKVKMENVDVFRADEGLIRNVYNGVLRRDTKWNETNGGFAKKEPGPQDLASHRIDFVVHQLTAIDCVLFPHFFTGGNMGTLPKTFAFRNVSIPHATGSPCWQAIGRTNGASVVMLHDSARWLDTENYALAITNLYLGGVAVDAFPPCAWTPNPRLRLTVVKDEKPTQRRVPLVPDRVEVDWTAPRKMAHAGVKAGGNLVEDRPSTRSVWQRFPSWLAKLEATRREAGARVYRLVQCEKGGGMQAIVTDGFRAAGNGRWKVSFDLRARSENPFSLRVWLVSNEKRLEKTVTILEKPTGTLTDWKRYEVDFDTDFDLSLTDLMSLGFAATATADEIQFRSLGFKQMEKRRVQN